MKHNSRPLVADPSVGIRIGTQSLLVELYSDVLQIVQDMTCDECVAIEDVFDDLQQLAQKILKHIQGFNHEGLRKGQENGKC